MGVKIVGSILFLRFICPFIVSPHKFNIAPHCKRFLILHSEASNKDNYFYFDEQQVVNPLNQA